MTVFPAQERTQVAEALIDLATAVTTVEVSDRRGPLDLEVITYRTAHDAIDLARGLQQHLAVSLHPSNSLKSQ